MNVVFGHARRILVMSRGKIVARARPSEIRANRLVREVYLGQTAPGGTVRRGMALLDIDALDAWYGQAQILRGISLAVDAGEVAVLLGRNGAGKSTTLKAIMGLEVERSGRDHVRRRRHRPAACASRSRALGLGYVPEERRIFTSLTVEENLAVGRLPARGRARLDAWRSCSACSPTSPACAAGRAGTCRAASSRC